MDHAEMEDTIRRLRYHVGLLSEALPTQGNELTKLIVSFNWDDEDLDDARAIFDEYQQKCEQGKQITENSIEHDFRKRFDMHYQRFKSVVLAFYANREFRDVCIQFAFHQDVLEFHPIMRENHKYIPPGEKVPLSQSTARGKAGAVLKPRSSSNGKKRTKKVTKKKRP